MRAKHDWRFAYERVISITRIQSLEYIMEPQLTPNIWPPAPKIALPMREEPTTRLLTGSVESDERIGSNGAYVFLIGFFLIHHLWFMGYLGRRSLYHILWQCHLTALAEIIGYTPLLGAALLFPVLSLWLIWYTPVAGKMFTKDTIYLTVCGVVGYFLVSRVLDVFWH